MVGCTTENLFINPLRGVERCYKMMPLINEREEEEVGYR